MREVIELFRERDTVDELGIGSVRDAFSDLLFPGMNVLMTRARYFLFIPWVYLGLEGRRVPSNAIGARARRAEVDLISALLAGGESQGVIGIDAREGLKQLPSALYWTGLRALGVRLFPGTRDQYHRSLDGHYAAGRSRPAVEGDEPVEGAPGNWHPGVPAPPDGFLERAVFSLTREEARFLRERVQLAAPASLLSSLVAVPGPPETADFVWQHPRLGSFSAEHRDQLVLARAFSDVIVGARLLYNLMLAERSQSVRVDEHLACLNAWSGSVEAPSPPAWSWDRFWATALSVNPRITRPTRRFVERWFTLAAGLGPAVADDERARVFIIEREREVKRGQARLDSLRALELWDADPGLSQIDFRWSVVRRVVGDITSAIGDPGSDGAGA